MINSLGYSYSTVLHTGYTSKVKSSEQNINSQSQSKENTKTREVITKLEARDAEVRAHEAAHMSAGGSVAGTASFDYQIGPNGKAYAIGGEVPIDISPENDPKATQAKMQKVRASALAPASPSPQDIKVAATASMIEMKAKMEELKESGDSIQKNGVKKYEEVQSAVS